MRNIWTILAAGLALLLLGNTAMASVMQSEVGSIDTLLASTTLANSGDATEEAWVESVLGFDVSFDSKGNAGTYSIDMCIDCGYNDVFAFEFATGEPEYYLLKIGTGSLSIDSHYLFSNQQSLDWAVFRLQGQIGLSQIDIGRISHIVEFNSQNDVPEPGVLGLLGLGLIGLVLTRRRRPV